MALMVGAVFAGAQAAGTPQHNETTHGSRQAGPVLWGTGARGAARSSSALDPARLYSLDIETDTAGGYGLDPAKGGITTVAVETASESAVLMIEDFGGSEERLLRAFNQLLGWLPAGVIATWYGSGFDAVFMTCRMERLGIRSGIELCYDPSLPLPHDPLPGHPGAYRVVFDRHGHFDVAYGYREFAMSTGTPWSLKPTARAHGLEVIEVDRTRMHELSRSEREAYASSDARLTRELALMLGGRVVADRLPVAAAA